MFLFWGRRVAHIFNKCYLSILYDWTIMCYLWCLRSHIFVSLIQFIFYHIYLLTTHDYAILNTEYKCAATRVKVHAVWHIFRIGADRWYAVIEHSVNELNYYRIRAQWLWSGMHGIENMDALRNVTAIQKTKVRGLVFLTDSNCCARDLAVLFIIMTGNICQNPA